MKLVRNSIEKPWGRGDLPEWLSNNGDAQVGEVWFAAPAGGQLPLLVKYIFTEQRLSIQVHPDDAQAKARGHANGKTECWYILEARPGATIGVGLKRPVSREDLRAAALDGSIESLLDWKPVTPGDFFYIPAGTIHAIGAGITLIEIQQFSDVTFRLYDYGRPRELHLDDGVAVADPSPYPAELTCKAASGSSILVNGPHFMVVRMQGSSDALLDRERMMVPISGNIQAGGDSAGPGECLLVSPGIRIEASPEAAYLLASARLA